MHFNKQIFSLQFLIGGTIIQVMRETASGVGGGTLIEFHFTATVLVVECGQPGDGPAAWCRNHRRVQQSAAKENI